MLRKETVTSGTLELLKKLMLDQRLSDFFLVGGTALSLQIGRRISIDLDMFSTTAFDERLILVYLESKNGFNSDYSSKHILKGQIDEIKVDFITHAYPLIEPLLVLENIRLASLRDIAAMKLNTISGNGTRIKDFIDIAYLSTYLSLQQMIEAYEVKYSSRNPVMIMKALAFHNDINFEEPVNMIDRKYKWKVIEKRLAEMGLSPFTVFKDKPFA